MPGFMKIEDPTETEQRWKEIDAWGHRLAGKKGEVDVEIGEWLMAARKEEVHRRFAYGSLHEYAERRIGLEPHSIGERLRVAEALVGLPQLREALRQGKHCWSAIRELTRVVVPETEETWLEATDGMRAQDVGRMVSGRRPGQLPDDPADPAERPHVLRFEVSAESFALFREAVEALRRQVDPHLSEEQVLAEMARRVLGGPQDLGRSPYQVALTRCRDCERAWMRAKGEQVEVGPALIGRAECDGQQIGAIDGPGEDEEQSHVGQTTSGSRSGRPERKTERATQTIPPAVRRLVMRRDGGRCKVPGCKSSVWLEVHHLWLREDGGDHDPSRLSVLCGAHHDLIHRGHLLVEGASIKDIVFRHADGTVYGKTPDTEKIAVYELAFGGLRKMGFKQTETKRFLARVRSQLGAGASLEEVVRLALGFAAEGSSTVSRPSTLHPSSAMM